MSAYAIYKELFPPQTVEHVQRGHFTSPDTINLIVAKASLLQIYNFIEYVPQSNTTTDANNADNTQDNVEENDLDTQNRLGTREDEEQVGCVI